MGESSKLYDKERGIKIIAAKLADYPDSMSWIIERYKEIERVDDASVQRLLGIGQSEYYHLAICGRPRSDLFSSDIESLAERFKISQEPLIGLVRRVESIDTFQRYADAVGPAMLAAARDIAEDEPAYDATTEEAEQPPAEPDDEQ